MTEQDGGLVYPGKRMERIARVGSEETQPAEVTHAGLTVLQWYAGKALQGLIADPSTQESAQQFASMAFNFAEAMIAEEIKRYGRV